MRGELEVQEVQIDTRIEAPGEGNCPEVKVLQQLLQDALDGLTNQKNLQEALINTKAYSAKLVNEINQLRRELANKSMPEFANKVIDQVLDLPFSGGGAQPISSGGTINLPITLTTQPMGTLKVTTISGTAQPTWSTNTWPVSAQLLDPITGEPITGAYQGHGAGKCMPIKKKVSI